MASRQNRKTKNAPKADTRRGQRRNVAETQKGAIPNSDAVDNGTTAKRPSLFERHSSPSAFQSSGGLSQASPPAPAWPDPLREEAFYGLAGEIVHTIEPHTESDPAALLLQFVAAFGDVIGGGPHWRAEADRHALNLFVVLVGATSKGRKGTSLGHVRRLIGVMDPDWERDRYQSGLSSGEGLIHAVRDPLGGGDAGVSDKRLFVVESEFASTLRVLSRDGNTLSPIIRLAWDGGKLQVLTKNSPATATGAHISMVAHVTKDELVRELTRTDAANGFANRFLWCCVRRSKVLPEGGHVPEADQRRLEENLQIAVEFVSCWGDRELKRDAKAKNLWQEIYEGLSEGKPGLLGAVTSRGEAQVMRLASIYALLDSVLEIQQQHLRAALAVWEYCEASARFIFGDALGDPLADELLRMLRQEEKGLTRTEISGAFGRNKSAAEIGRALAVLADQGLVTAKKEETPGRPSERWVACRS